MTHNKVSEETIAILGASRLYLGYIDRAREMGHRVLVFDRDDKAFCIPRADCFLHIDITNRQAVLKACRERRVTGILALNDFGVETQAYVAEQMGLPGVGVEVAARCIDKWVMRTCWEKAGIPTPFYRRVLTIEEARKAAADGPGYPYVLKPANSRGGGQRGVSIAKDEGDLPRAFAFANQAYADGKVLIEECLVGSEHTLEAFVWRGKTHILAISDRFKVRDVYRVDKTIVYPSMLPAGDKSVIEMVSRTIDALGIENGAVHLEFCRTGTEMIPFEIGARGGGGVISTHIVPYVCGVDFPGSMIRWVVGKDPGSLSPVCNKSAVIRFLTPEPGRVLEIEGFDEIEDKCLDAAVFPKIGDVVREVRTGPDRSGYLVTGAATIKEAIEKADFFEKRLQIRVGPVTKP